ncbi:MAG: thioredoxin [Clostridium sp.]|jgi:thioredoxin 1|nr:thioredoxin [Clostridium sp.]
MAGKKVIALTKDNFEQEVLNYDGVIMVDFWAPWCGPCMAVGPIIDELANEYDGKAKVAKINIDDEGEFAAQYRVMSIPTIMLFKKGEVVERVVGARTKKEFAALIDKHI